MLIDVTELERRRIISSLIMLKKAIDRGEVKHTSDKTVESIDRLIQKFRNI